MRHPNSKIDHFLTIVYHDLFDYPLTKEQIYRFRLIARTILHKKKLPKDIYKLLSYQNGYYYLIGREDIIVERRRRMRISRIKIQFARKIALILSVIPWVQLIGLSGSVSILNAQEGDDIDFYIVSSLKMIWTTRLLVILMTTMLQVRRRRKERYKKNKICLNMFVDESKLGINRLHRSLYMAHEVAQMVPLVNKSHTYEKFVTCNQWVSLFLPNALPKVVQYKKTNRKKPIFILQAIEWLAKAAQYWYIQRHRSREIISDTVLAFHPIDRKAEIMSLFYRRIQHYEI